VNLAELAIDRAADAPHAVAVRFGDRALTYGAFMTESRRVAGGLRELGVVAGSRVLLLAENCPGALVLYHAVSSLGAIFVPVHPSYESRELRYVVDNAAASVTVVSTSTLPTFLHAHRGAETPGVTVVLDDPYGGPDVARRVTGADLSWSEMSRQGTPLERPVEMDSAAPVLICYTSGTTDTPHPVVRSHGAEVWNARTYASIWDYRRDDIALVALPLCWVYGLSTLSQGLLAAGACVDLLTEFDPENVVDAIATRGITAFAGTATMYARLLQARHVETLRDVTTLRRLYVGGEPTDPALARQVEERIGLPMTQAYAATEAAPVLAVEPRAAGRVPEGTVGRLVPGAEIKIVDHDGSIVAPGNVGEALLRCPGLMTGYWREPELTQQRLTPDGWFKSGDMLVEGADGYHFVVGRSAEIVIRAGMKVAPTEVESALQSIPTVRSAACVGVPDDEFGETIVAFIVPTDGFEISIDDVYDSLSDRIARFKHPSHIFVCTELPIATMGKRDRKRLGRLASGDHRQRPDGQRRRGQDLVIDRPNSLGGFTMDPRSKPSKDIYIEIRLFICCSHGPASITAHRAPSATQKDTYTHAFDPRRSLHRGCLRTSHAVRPGQERVAAERRGLQGRPRRCRAAPRPGGCLLHLIDGIRGWLPRRLRSNHGR
jgi:long-chain acyl-CoA synthetase